MSRRGRGCCGVLTGLPDAMSSPLCGATSCFPLSLCPCPSPTAHIGLGWPRGALGGSGHPEGWGLGPHFPGVGVGQLGGGQQGEMGACSFLKVIICCIKVVLGRALWDPGNPVMDQDKDNGEG